MQIPGAVKNCVIIAPILDSQEGGYTTSGGIFVPQIAEENQVRKAHTAKAIVVSTGPGVDEVNIDDVVIYNKYGAKPLGPGFEQFFNININEIFGVVNQ